MEQTVCRTYFLIKGEFDLSEISNIIKIKNTGGHAIGDKKKYAPGFYDWAAWEYGTGYIETVLACEQAETVLRRISQI